MAALLLVDAGGSEMLNEIERQVPWRRVAAACAVAPAVARVGLIRVSDPFRIEPGRSEERARSR